MGIGGFKKYYEEYLYIFILPIGAVLWSCQKQIVGAHFSLS